MEKYKHLKEEERYRIYRLLRDGISCRKIAEELQVHRSTIYREIKRNKFQDGSYLPDKAHSLAKERAPRRGYNKIENSKWLKKKISDYIAMEWSPDAISGRLESDSGKQIISHESIYKWIYGAGKLLKLIQYLHRKKRKRGRRPCLKVKQSKIPNRVSIHDRPKDVNTTFGHWECDTVIFRGRKGSILTLYEKKSKLFLGAKMHTRQASETNLNIETLLKEIPAQARKTLTFDNGSEFFNHQQVRNRFGIDTYFCDPYASWQKGGVENANGLLRRYIPKASRADQHSVDDVLSYFRRINSIPRKSLGYKTPYESFLLNLNPDLKLLNLTNIDVALHD